MQSAMEVHALGVNFFGTPFSMSTQPVPGTSTLSQAWEAAEPIISPTGAVPSAPPADGAVRR